MCKFDNSIGAYVLEWGDSVLQFAENVIAKVKEYGHPVRVVVDDTVYLINNNCKVGDLLDMINCARLELKNNEGYNDPTAYEAIKRIDSNKDKERVKKLIGCIYRICELSGFELTNRVELRDVNTGREWK